MKKNSWISALALLVCLVFSTQVMAQEERTEEKSNTKVIIIEEKVDKYGNKTVNKTVKEGDFTDEEIEKMIEGEGMPGKDSKVLFWDDSDEKSGYLGVQITDTEEGVEITEVVEGTAAADASLNAGDIITSINGNDVEDMEELVDMVSDLAPGTDVTIGYLREGEAATTTATLGSRSNVFEMEFGDFEMGDFEWTEEGDFDMEELQEKMEDLQKKMEIMQEKMHHKMEKMHEKEHKMHKEEHQKMRELEERLHEEHMNEAPKPRFGVYIEEADGGVLVTDVVHGSLAADAGLNEGDIITSFNGVDVSTPDALIEAVNAAEAGEKISMKYLRDGKSQKASVKFE